MLRGLLGTLLFAKGHETSRSNTDRPQNNPSQKDAAFLDRYIGPSIMGPFSLLAGCTPASRQTAGDPIFPEDYVAPGNTDAGRDVGEGEGEGPPDVGEGEGAPDVGEGEGEGAPDVGEGEGEGAPDVGEGEGEGTPDVGEGEGEGAPDVGEGEGEGAPDVGEGEGEGPVYPDLNCTYAPNQEAEVRVPGGEAVTLNWFATGAERFLCQEDSIPLDPNNTDVPVSIERIAQGSTVYGICSVTREGEEAVFCPPVQVTGDLPPVIEEPYYPVGENILATPEEEGGDQCHLEPNFIEFCWSCSDPDGSIVESSAAVTYNGNLIETLEGLSVGENRFCGTLSAELLDPEQIYQPRLHSWSVTCTDDFGQTIESPAQNFTTGIAEGCTDEDGDGLVALRDNCPDTPNADQADTIHLEGQPVNGIGDACDDTDDDGFFDATDNCPLVANADQSDTVHLEGEAVNGIGDACDDTDDDGVLDNIDNCPLVANPEQEDNVTPNGVGDACDDTDGDGINDAADNCPLVENPNQEDVTPPNNNNGIGDACETDIDGDGVVNEEDNCPNIANPNQEDIITVNGIGDACDDTDNDGINDAVDNCPLVPNENQEDLVHAGGPGDHCEDPDGDGVADFRDNCPDVANPLQEPGQEGKGEACTPSCTVLNPNTRIPRNRDEGYTVDIDFNIRAVQNLICNGERSPIDTFEEHVETVALPAAEGAVRCFAEENEDVECLPPISIVENRLATIGPFISPVDGAVGVLANGNGAFVAPNTVGAQAEVNDPDGDDLECDSTYYDYNSNPIFTVTTQIPNGANFSYAIPAEQLTALSKHKWSITECRDGFDSVFSDARATFYTSDVGLEAGYIMDVNDDETVIDISGHGRNAALEGNAERAVGVRGNGVRLNGAGYITAVPEEGDTFGIGDSWTFSLFLTYAPDARQSIIDFGNEENRSAFGISTDGHTIDMAHFGENGTEADFRSENPPLLPSIWQHLALTKNGGDIRLYVNGAPVPFVLTEGAVTPQAERTRTLTIGQDPVRGGLFLAGDVDNFFMYSRALSAQEVSEQCQACDPNGDICIPPAE